MKKITVSCISLLLAVLLCSCCIPALQRECFSVPENFLCDVFVTENDIDYEGTLERNDGKYILTITSPEGVSGLEVEFEDGKYAAHLNGCSTVILPERDFFMKDMIDFIECSIGNENVDYVIRGNAYIIEKETFTLRFKADN